MPDIHALYVSHGGGPMPLLGDPDHREMVACLRQIATQIQEPEAIIVVSAHWEADVPTVSGAAQPGLIYDYAGFPPQSYAIEYPCPGDPELADLVEDALRDAGLAAQQDAARGLDHGVFVPLKIMYPDAHIPCLQLSLIEGLAPDQHIEAGRALRALDVDNLLVIGSGFSFHNMHAFFAPERDNIRAQNEAFEGWLVEICSDPALPEDQREQQLVDWHTAPGARFCHPREEHLLPLHVCYGVAQAPCSEYWRLQVLNKACSMYYW